MSKEILTYSKRDLHYKECREILKTIQEAIMTAKDRKGSTRNKNAMLAKLNSIIPGSHMLMEIGIVEGLVKDKIRTQVLNYDTFLDNLLKDILITNFPRRDTKDVEKLFDPNIGGPLVSVANKARLAYALGLIDKTALNYSEYIHKIRNQFAHNVQMDFDDTGVVRLVEKLSTVKGNNKFNPTNSYESFKSAVSECLRRLQIIFDQESDKQIELLRAK
jgi:DNA-binding MltR family transcriptional regulator